MKSLKIVGFFFLLLLLNACHKDELKETENTTPVPTPVMLQETSGDILGYVYNEQNLPVGEATVRLYSEVTTTDKYGVFRFKNVSLDQLGTYLRVEKSGYIIGSDYIYPTDGLNYAYVHLYQLDNAYSFNASEGGTVSLNEGGKIIFAPNSIQNENGDAYSGKVNVTAKRLSTDDPKLADKMPGALRGEATNKNTVVLGTYGMINAELRDNSGNELNLKEGATAHVEFPITESLRANAPAEIPLV